MVSCCRLGAELNSREKVLYESDNFFVIPTIGQMGIEGYLLLCSKEHFIGVGDVPAQYESELEEVLKTTRGVLSEHYNSDVLVFEHGPRIGCHRGGGCLDHSHLHILPISINLIESMALNLLNALQVKDYSKIERIDSFGRLRDLYSSQEASYMFVESCDLKRYVTEVNFVIPSQYLRQIIALNIGATDWDWRSNPDHETVDRTVNNLQNRF